MYQTSEKLSETIAHTESTLVTKQKHWYVYFTQPFHRKNDNDKVLLSEHLDLEYWNVAPQEVLLFSDIFLQNIIV